MLNEPTYPHLARDFWVKSEVYDEVVASMEENQKASGDNSLKGKSRKEMGLKEFEEVEIRSDVMGVDVTVTQKIIAKFLGVSPMRRCTLNTKESNPEAGVIKTRLFELSENTSTSLDFGKVKNMKTPYKLLFKILIGCMIPREGSTD